MPIPSVQAFTIPESNESSHDTNLSKLIPKYVLVLDCYRDHST